MEGLTTEKEFFLYSYEDVLESEVLIYDEKEGEITGMAGFRLLPEALRYFLRLPVAYVVVHREFQGQSLGKRLFDERYRIAKEKYNFLLNTTSKKNSKMLGLMKKLDHKIIGETNDRYYFMKPFNFYGQCMYYLLKVGFKVLMLSRYFSPKLKTAS